jgi:hypothetical protein
MTGRSDLRRAAPWVLCAVSLGMLLLSNTLRWIYRADVPAGEVDWLAGTISALGIAGIPVVGALIASRLPGNPYGWLWCGVGLAYAVNDLAAPLARAAGWPLWVKWLLVGWGFASLIGLFVFVFLLFPTGRLPSRRWRWVSRADVSFVVLLIVAVPLISDPDDSSTLSPWGVHGVAGRYLGSATVGAVYGIFGLVLVAMSSLVLRFRRGNSVVRRQLSWFLYATAVNAVFFVLDSVLGVLPATLFFEAVSAASFALLPLAVGIAVFRYRLFEIDRIVSRTVSYGLLSAGLIGLYLLVVAFLRPLLEPLTGSSALAVAASTLAVAAVFNPARRRLQTAVDRRFDRARYDAARAVEAFAARLRDQVDVDEIAAGLRDTVVATVSPGRISVWLRAPTEPRGSRP